MIPRKIILIGTVAALVLGTGGVIALIANAQTPVSGDEHASHRSNGGMASMPGMEEMPGMEMPGMETPGMRMPGTASAPTSGLVLPEGLSVVTIGPAIQQRIGVTFGEVEQMPLLMQVRTVGIVRPDETRLAHVHLKTEGWVTKLFVSFTGQQVKAGEPLLTIYSPAFFTAQREFLAALQVGKIAPSADQQIVVDAARGRLELWDVPKEEIDSLERTGKAVTTLTLRTPIGGTVLEKKAFVGQYVTPQEELYLVADLSTVWVQAKVYEYELPHIALDMPVSVTLPSMPGKVLSGKVAFIDPTVEEPARTVQVRIELPNEENLLKPGMFANVVISHDMGQGLTVPESAVIRTGTRNIAYLAESQDRFVPVEVVISPISFNGRFQVLKGLSAGQTVVTSANFLIDSESRLRAGTAAMARMPGMEGMDMGGQRRPAPTASQRQHSH